MVDKNHTKHQLTGIITGTAVFALLVLFFWLPASAEAKTQGIFRKTAVSPTLPALTHPTRTITPTHATADLACILCHSDSSQSVTFPSGETLPVQIDTAVLAASAHGTQAGTPLNCASCHAPTSYQFPHPPVETTDLRGYQLQQSGTCTQCHQQPHLTSHPGPETENPVTCTDCHGSHEVATIEQWQTGGETAVCVNCHEQQGVELADGVQLTAVIQNGLFAERVAPNNDYCLACHSLPDRTLTFANGDTLPLTIDLQTFHDSVHGENNEWDALQCTDCHQNYRFPHEPVVVTTARDYTLTQAASCITCHEQNSQETQESVHTLALADGEKEAAVCTDCHGAHDTVAPDEPRSRISQTCRQCHSTIFDDYATSVHGEALLNEGNPDVPDCTSCHGVHNIPSPLTAEFRIQSPQLCGQCHADEELMTQYEVSTDVFETYVADFHGTTVTLFENQDPSVETNKAVCYDCHGVHDIKAPDDPHAGIKENLLATCQQCHPDATANFSDAWTSHFRPSLEHNPLVYLVNLFYQFVIPATVGFLGFLVLTDIYRRVRLSVKRS